LEIRRGRGRNRLTPSAQPWAGRAELGPISSRQFLATPNGGIRARIPEFRILGPIRCNQTQCNVNDAYKHFDQLY
jgi:hypothetical protein